MELRRANNYLQSRLYNHYCLNCEQYFGTFFSLKLLIRERVRVKTLKKWFEQIGFRVVFPTNLLFQKEEKWVKLISRKLDWIEFRKRSSFAFYPDFDKQYNFNFLFSIHECNLALVKHRFDFHFFKLIFFGFLGVFFLLKTVKEIRWQICCDHVVAMDSENVSRNILLLFIAMGHSSLCILVSKKKEIKVSRPNWK